MPVDYISPTELQNEWISQISTGSWTSVARVCTAASRYIDRFCNRRFYTTTGDETKYFDGPRHETREWSPELDLASITTLALAISEAAGSSGTYASISTGDFSQEPYDRLDGWPATYLRLNETYIGTYNSSAPYPNVFMPGNRTIYITGKFGWASTDVSSTNFPQELRVVAAEVATWLWRSRESGFSNVSAVSDLGGTLVPRALTPWSHQVLDSYRKSSSR